MTDNEKLPSQAFLCCVTSRDRIVAVVVQYEAWHGAQVALDESLSTDEGVDAFHVACMEMKNQKVCETADPMLLCQLLLWLAIVWPLLLTLSLPLSHP